MTLRTRFRCLATGTAPSLAALLTVALEAEPRAESLVPPAEREIGLPTLANLPYFLPPPNAPPRHS